MIDGVNTLWKEDKELVAKQSDKAASVQGKLWRKLAHCSR